MLTLADSFAGADEGATWLQSAHWIVHLCQRPSTTGCCMQGQVQTWLFSAEFRYAIATATSGPGHLGAGVIHFTARSAGLAASTTGEWILASRRPGAQYKGALDFHKHWHIPHTWSQVYEHSNMLGWTGKLRVFDMR